MRWINILRLRLRSLFRRSAVDRDLADEFRFHLEVQIQQHLAAGMMPEQARTAARREFGSPALHEDECRDARGITLIADFREDFRHALRGLSRDRFLACAATVTLTLAIGATTTVFSIANSVLIRPLPYPHADRIEWISETSGPAHDEIAAAPDYYRLRERNRIFEEVGNYWPLIFNWTGIEHPERLQGAYVPHSFFRVMGTAPLLGRYVSRSSVVRLVLGETAAVSSYAIAAGLAGAWALTRYIKSMLYGITELDSVTFALTSVLLILVVLVASLGPARRAAQVDPVTALKDE